MVRSLHHVPAKFQSLLNGWRALRRLPLLERDHFSFLEHPVEGLSANTQPVVTQGHALLTWVTCCHFVDLRLDSLEVFFRSNLQFTKSLLKPTLFAQKLQESTYSSGPVARSAVEAANLTDAVENLPWSAVSY